MQSGEFIIDRLLPEFVRTACERQGITFQSFSDDWVLRLQRSSQARWVLGYKFDLNSAAASGVAQDKVAAYQVLSANNIPVLPHFLVRSVASQPLPVHELRQVFASRPVVIKPLTGTGGRGVQKCDSVAIALEQIAADPEPAWAISLYVDVAAEYRLIVLDGEVLLAYEKTKPTERDGLKLFNLGTGAVAQDITASDTIQNIALEATRTLNLRLAAVDIIKTDQAFEILEVNDGMMMENYARQSTDHRARAARIYDRIVTAMFAG